MIGTTILRRAGLACLLLPVAFLPERALSGAPPDSIVRRAEVRAFLEEEVEFDRYLFPPGEFPRPRWKNPETVRKTAGPVPLDVEYYDHAFTRVGTAVRPGRYGAVVRGITPGGFPIVRYVTLYSSGARYEDYAPDVPLTVNPLPGDGVAPEAWSAYRQNLRRFSFGSLLLSPEHDPDAAIFLAGMAELRPGASPDETPRLIDRRWWTLFKRQHDGLAHPPVSLAPRRADYPAPVIASLGDQKPPPLAPADVTTLRALCASWTDSTGVPMTPLVLHRGRILFHESFGRTRAGEAMTPATPTWMASITKTLTGVLVMQFVERGLLDLDASLERYLPELSASPGSAGATACPLTLRLLLTHTSGLAWAGEWASDWNPSMENQIAQALTVTAPGREFRYHRVGYALAAKVLERVSGVTVPELFRTMIFSPLGMNSSFADNTYGGLYASALDLAKFGEMLRNHGSYGDQEILSEKAWRDLLPAPLPLKEGTSNQRWGIGTSPFVRDGLSSEAFGHAAASGAIFRVDPRRELVIVIGRDSVGRDENLHRRFASRFVRLLTDALDRSAGHE
jgi:CubicO group peptidase (beta-lactamase class C family)